MVERSFPFDETPEGAPAETFEADFSGILQQSLGDGTFPNDLLATIQGLNILVGPGRAFCRGYGYVNDSSVSIPIELNPHSTLHRLDRIFLRLTKDTNEVLLHKVEGVPTSGADGDAGDRYRNGPSPVQTANTWDVFMYSVLVPPNNSAALTLHDERNFAIVNSTGFRSGVGAQQYENVFSEGQMSFIRGINYWPHWVTSLAGQGLAEFQVEGPRRLLRKSGEQSRAVNGNWQPVSGWETLENNRVSVGSNMTLVGSSGLQVHYPGFYRIQANVRVTNGSGTGRRSLRVVNRTTGTVYNYDDVHVTMGNSIFSVHVDVERWVGRNEVIGIDVTGTGSSSAMTIRTSSTFMVKYLTSGRITEE